MKAMTTTYLNTRFSEESSPQAMGMLAMRAQNYPRVLRKNPYLQKYSPAFRVTTGYTGSLQSHKTLPGRSS